MTVKDVILLAYAAGLAMGFLIGRYCYPVKKYKERNKS